MGCKYCNFEGMCELYHPSIEDCTEDGICVVDDDPNPEDSCENYESIDD